MKIKEQKKPKLGRAQMREIERLEEQKSKLDEIFSALEMETKKKINSF